VVRPNGFVYIPVNEIRFVQDMSPGEVIMSDGFTLQDAMSAFEVGYDAASCYLNVLIFERDRRATIG
jgi:hypothetical protein